MNRILSLVLFILLALFVIATGSIIIKDGSEILAGLGSYIVELFRDARLDPGDSHGFSATVRLIILAILVGWAINRFKRWRKK